MLNRRSLIMLTAIGLLAFSQTAYAHFPWLVVTEPHSEKPALQCYFGEGPEPDDPALLKYVANAKVWRVPARGDAEEIKLQQSAESLSATLDPKHSESLFALKHSLGVFTRGDAAFQLHYYSKTGPALPSWHWKRAKTGTLVDLDVVPSVEDGQLSVQVRFRGEPAPAAEVTLYGESDEETTLVADESGVARHGLDKNAIFALRVKYVEQKSGELDGKKYDDIRHFTTVTFPDAAWNALTAETPFAELPQLVTSFGAAVAADHLFVYGGHTGQAHSYSVEGQANTLWTLNLSGDSKWESAGTGPKLQGLAMVAHGGRLYRIGGFTAKNKDGDDHDLWSQSGVARFDPSPGQWTDLPPLPEPRSSFDAAVLRDTIYVIGGWSMAGDADNVWHETAWALDVSQDKLEWKPLPAPPFQRRALSVAAHDDKVYAIGGMQPHGGSTTRVAVFDPKAGVWSEGPRLIGSSMTGFGSSSFAVDDRLYVSTYDGTLQRLSDDGAAWDVVGNLERARFFHRMLPLKSGNLLLVGGANMSSGKFAELDVVGAQ